LPASFATPAIAATEPFGFSLVAQDDLAVRSSSASSSVVREVAALAVLDRDRQALPRSARA
jgi:hypothetical protein